MTVNVLQTTTTENIYVKTLKNSYVDAYDPYFCEYVVVPLADTIERDWNCSEYHLA